MNEFQTGAVRDTGGKGRMDLLPWSALIRISKHMENTVSPDPETGIPHYPERDWEKGLPMHTMMDSAFRHMAKYMSGQTDEDHLCAAATNLLMALWTEDNRPDMQDIPTRMVGAGSEKSTQEPICLRDQERPFLGTSGTEEPLEPVQTENGQGSTTEGQEEVCSHFDPDPNFEDRCMATKDHDTCTCGGNKSLCDYYATFRNAKQG